MRPLSLLAWALWCAATVWTGWAPAARALDRTQSARPEPRAAQREQPTIRREVSLVSVLASVQTREGQPVAGLPAEAFELYEEGAKQRIEVFEAETQQPLDLALLIDTSASTFKEFGFIREAAARFLRQVVRPGDRAAVFQFADTVEQLAEFTNRLETLEASLQRLETGSATAMYDALVLGAQTLERRPPGRRRVLLVITDAGESASLSSFEQARRAALTAEAMLYTILVRPVKSESGRNTRGEHALSTITEVTGGATYTVDEEGQFDSTFERINRELRTQYRLAYYPTPRPPAGAYRRIEVRVRREEGEPLVIRHRRGYFTSLPE